VANGVGGGISDLIGKDKSRPSREARATRQVVLFLVFVSLFLSFTLAFYSYVDSTVVEHIITNGLGVLGLLGVIISLCVAVFMISYSAKDPDINDAEKASSIKTSPHVYIRDKNGRITSMRLAQNSAPPKPPLQEVNEKPVEGHLESRKLLDMPFEDYLNAIVQALDVRISLSEIKANGLLKQGKGLMKWGVALYTLTVIGWQFAAHSWGYSHTLLVGMISCSLMFVVVEFMAAWLLKQYRSYVDSSMAYLQVRSVYSNYLLAYYTVNQMSSIPEGRDIIVKMLCEEIKWPALNDLHKNDFNYMVEAISGFTVVVDKLKATFASGSQKPADTVKPKPEG